MAVTVGSARSNENGKANGGKAGDQTGNEVSTQNWYLHTKGWIVIRAKNPFIAKKIAYCMKGACYNSNYGYCQDHRTTAIDESKKYGYDSWKVTKPVEIDCSELVRQCIMYAGISVPDFTTANQVAVCRKTGQFDILLDTKYTNSSDYLKIGDILVTKTQGHTVVVLSNGPKVVDDAQIGWHQDENGWWYITNENGDFYKNTWALINHYWYYFNNDGYMLVGWQTINDEWYYLDPTPGSTQGQCWHEKVGGKGALEPWYVE